MPKGFPNKAMDGWMEDHASPGGITRGVQLLARRSTLSRRCSCISCSGLFFCCAAFLLCVPAGLLLGFADCFSIFCYRFIPPLFLFLLCVFLSLRALSFSPLSLLGLAISLALRLFCHLIYLSMHFVSTVFCAFI